MYMLDIFVSVTAKLDNNYINLTLFLKHYEQNVVELLFCRSVQ